MMSGKLTTHVLDIAHGTPGAGMTVDLRRIAPDGTPTHVKTIVTNADGRPGEPLLADDAFTAGTYELIFHVGEYFEEIYGPTKGGEFLHRVPVRFHVNDASHNYHVPLLCSRWSYTTYRGS